jgi:hypothetical protein
MASDIIHIAIDVINGVRHLVAAYQGKMCCNSQFNFEITGLVLAQGNHSWWLHPGN